MYLGEYRIDDYVTLVATTHRFSSGAAYAPTSITYRVYEDATDVEIVADTAMTNFDSQTGFYLDRIQCTAALGYETGKTYTALIKATVDSVAAITAYTWRVLTPPVNVTQVGGTAQTAGDLAAMITTVDDLIDTEVAAIKSDTAAILVDTGTTLDGRIPAALTANGNMKCSLMEILATALTETSGQIAAAFKQFFDVASPTGTMKAVTAVGSVTGSVGSVTGAVGSVTGAVGSVTGDVGGNIVGSVASVTGAVASVTGAVGSVTGAVGSVTGNVSGNVTGSVGSLATQAKADVNTEVVDALNVDTYAEPGQEAPGATVSLVKKIGYIYKAFRNKFTQDATTAKLYADDGTTVDQKSTVSDDATTFTRGEMGTGP